MTENNDNILPIGSVVLLKGGTKKVMIIGFYPNAEFEDEGGEKKALWDYSGCIYPEGLLSSEEILVFDHSQIVEVFYLGFKDDEEKEFNKKLIEASANIKKKSKKTGKKSN